MSDYRAGFIGLIGQPNAGKSTLMNFLVKQKVSIVTAKPQTTRRRVLGIANSKKGQIVFVDSPGLIQAEKGLNGFLAQEAEDVMRQSDAIWIILSVDEETIENAQQVIDLAASQKKPWMALITKTDITDKQHRIGILKELIGKKGGKFYSLTTKGNPSESEMVRTELIDAGIDILPVSPKPLYDIELFTPETTRSLCAEIIREKCFEFLHQELPYSLAVRILTYDELSHSVPHVAAEIIVSKENHKGMVIGKAGSILKKIGSEARTEIEKLVGEKIFLNLKVTFREDWFANNIIMKELGYVIEKSKN